MKFYLYVSDAKVDMLFSQVPHELKKKVATEWKIDLKLLDLLRREASLQLAVPLGLAALSTDC